MRGSKSSILFTETLSRPMRKERRRQYPAVPETLWYKVSRLKKSKNKPCKNETSRLIKNPSEISSSCQNFPRPTFFEVPFATPNKWFILWPNYRGFDSQRFFLPLFSVLRVGRLPRHWFISFSRLPFPASFAWTLNVPMIHCAILSLAVAFSVLQTHLRWDA